MQQIPERGERNDIAILSEWRGCFSCVYTVFMSLFALRKCALFAVV